MYEARLIVSCRTALWAACTQCCAVGIFTNRERETLISFHSRGFPMGVVPW